MARSHAVEPAAALALVVSLALVVGCDGKGRTEPAEPIDDDVAVAPSPALAEPSRDADATTVAALDVKDASGAHVVAATAAVGPCPDGMAFVAGGELSTLETGKRVAVGDFCLDVREVTVRAFREAVEHAHAARVGCDGTCPSVPTRTAWGDPSEDWIASKYCNGRREGRDDHPVNCVAIEEARLYCAGQGGRLPRGDEWEWAARGSGRLSTPWGMPVAADQICWGKPKKRDGTCRSGDHPLDRTPAGVLDLGGNVSEWTEPSGHVATKARFAHGASWYAIDDGYASAALGGFEMPAERAETIGFRCAADAKR